jgi:phage gpG-like protein
MSIRVDTSKLRELARNIESIDLDTDDVLDELGEVLAAGTLNRIAAERTPTGEAFKPLSPRYAARKRGGGILHETGRLAGSIQSIADGVDEVIVGSDVFYARMNQIERPFLGIDDQETEIVEVVSDALERAIADAA